ncbi:MAG: hypothetical protein DRP47_11820 [Candidatus Zixiibacteriota bacterium]|nr:MAG: hypothetical protein DRP47_11820 [candidate division Zixibacteria bacterium]
MKKMLLPLVVSFLLFLSISAFAQNQTEDLYIYNHNTKYDGSFDAERVYLYNDADGIWQGFKTMRQFKCSDARRALISTGSWVGNLSDDGQCLGDAEAPEWTSGNYLNFRHEKNK